MKCMACDTPRKARALKRAWSGWRCRNVNFCWTRIRAKRKRYEALVKALLGGEV